MALHSNMTCVAMLWINQHSSMERAKSDGILPEGFDVKDDNSAVKLHAPCGMDKCCLIVRPFCIAVYLENERTFFVMHDFSRVMQCVNMCQCCYVGSKTRKYQRKCVELWNFKRYFAFAVYRQSQRIIFWATKGYAYENSSTRHSLS